MPGYVYLPSDGSRPKAPSTCPGKDTHDEIVDYWQGQTRFETGLAQETCRDFWHTGWGISAMAHVAETAWHQGVDLYDEAKDRLMNASYLLPGLGDPHPRRQSLSALGS